MLIKTLNAFLELYSHY